MLHTLQGRADDKGDGPIGPSVPIESAPSEVSLDEAKRAAEQLAVFLRAHPETFSADILLSCERDVYDNIIDMTRLNASRQQQRSITSFFTPIVNNNDSSS